MMRPTRPLRNPILDDPFSIDMVPSEGTVGAAFWDYEILEGNGSTADKIRRTVDILTWALTASCPAAILFISNDPDFASVLSALENRSCKVSVLLHPDAPSSILLDYAAEVIEWDKVFNKESSDHPTDASLIDLTSDERETTNSMWQSSSVGPRAPRRIGLMAPGHHPLAVLQDPLLSSSPQTQLRESPQQDSAPSSSRAGRYQVPGTDQSAGESTTNQTTPPNQPLRSFQLFKHLVHVLQELNDQTSQEWHAWGTVANTLVERDPEVFARLGFRRFRPYINVASKEAHIVSIKEPRGGDGEVSLNPREAWNVTF